MHIPTYLRFGLQVVYRRLPLQAINIYARLVSYKSIYVSYFFFHSQPNFVNMFITRSILQISHKPSHYWQELTDFNVKTALLWEFEKLSRAKSCNFWEMFLSNLIYFKPNILLDIIQLIFLRILNICIILPTKFYYNDNEVEAYSSNQIFSLLSAPFADI